MSPEEFWRFSVNTYQRSGVANACLTLQDRHGLDVNMVLFCLWAGFARGRLSDAALIGADALSEDWAARVVRPLRAIRRDMKAGFSDTGPLPAVEAEDFRQRVKVLELAAEERQQRAIAAAAQEARGPQGLDAARDNARALLARRLAGRAHDIPAAMALIEAILEKIPREGARLDAPDLDA